MTEDHYEENKRKAREALNYNRIQRFRKMMEVAAAIKRDFGNQMTDDVRCEIVREWESLKLIRDVEPVYVEVERQKKTPQHRLDQMKVYHKMVKLEKELEDKQDKINFKKELAMNREKAGCYKCGKVFDVPKDRDKKRVFIKERPRRNAKMILLEVNCQHCGQKLNIYCGKLPF